ncbi:unnamed protein product [Lampetra fluviatilis]
MGETAARGEPCSGRRGCEIKPEPHASVPFSSSGGGGGEEEEIPHFHDGARQCVFCVIKVRIMSCASGVPKWKNGVKATTRSAPPPATPLPQPLPPTHAAMSNPHVERHDDEEPLKSRARAVTSANEQKSQSSQTCE